jgi:hypothetical protein
VISTQRLDDLVARPRESLDVELKPWLDLRDEGDRANLAHALLAVANHGGGFVVLGFAEHDGKWTAAPGEPEGADRYCQDTVNEIVKKYADPAFHCEAHHVYGGHTVARMVIVVPGEHRVPVRARAAGPDNRHVKLNTYYIRRPGPESAPVQTAAEWERLIQRCVRAAKDELVDMLRAAMFGAPTASAPTTSERLTEWIGSSKSRLDALVKKHLSDEEPGRYARGVWTFSYALEEPVDLTLPALMDMMRRAHAPVTGWPAFLVMTNDALAQNGPSSLGHRVPPIRCFMRTDPCASQPHCSA